MSNGQSDSLHSFLTKVRQGEISIGRYWCDVCGTSFSHRSSLGRHHRQKHPNLPSRQRLPRPGQQFKLKPQTETRIICLEPDCDFGTNAVQGLRFHLTEVHGFSFTELERTFDSVTTFQEWKTGLEKCLRVNFVKQSGVRERGDGSVVAYLYCNRSGPRTQDVDLMQKKRRWVKGSCKLGIFCTAMMTVAIQASGAVKVNAVMDHYGHEIDDRHLRKSRLFSRNHMFQQNFQVTSVNSPCPELDQEEQLESHYDSQASGSAGHVRAPSLLTKDQKSPEDARWTLEKNLEEIGALLQKTPQSADLTEAIELAHNLKTALAGASLEEQDEHWDEELEVSTNQPIQRQSKQRIVPIRLGVARILHNPC